MNDRASVEKRLVLGILTQSIKITKKKFITVLLLFFPSFLWFYLFDGLLYFFIENLTADVFWIYLAKALFYVSIAVSAIIESIFSEKWNRRTVFKFWIFLGIIVTASLAVFQALVPILILGIIAGASFGLGFTSSLAFLADSTSVEERARVSGVAIFMTFISVVLTVSVITILQLGLIEYVIICVILRAISLLALLLDPCERVVCKENKWITVFTTHGFWLYFVSWLMFNLAGSIFSFIQFPQGLDVESVSMLGQILNFLGVVLSALISGVASDRFGRRKTIIFGLITLGVSYGLFGIVTSQATYLLTRIVYGSAWGIILVTYGLTVIGDLAITCSKEKFYAMGVVVPFILFSFSQIFSDAFSLSIPTSIISSILSMILFISVVPLLYAPETLPREKVRRRRFREHLKKVKELVEEERTRNHK